MLLKTWSEGNGVSFVCAFLLLHLRPDTCSAKLGCVLLRVYFYHTTYIHGAKFSRSLLIAHHRVSKQETGGKKKEKKKKIMK